jgi:hypothetical protein
MRRVVALLAVSLALTLVPGCGSRLLTREQARTAPWRSFRTTKQAYDRIVVTQTTADDLEALRLDPASSEASTVVSYVDVLAYFAPNKGIALEAADPGVQRCVHIRERCIAWRIEITRRKQQRIGMALLDWMLFRRTTRTTGWDFRMLVLMEDDLVIYKLWSALPSILEYRDRIWPLGFLTELFSVIVPGIVNGNSESTP